MQAGEGEGKAEEDLAGRVLQASEEDTASLGRSARRDSVSHSKFARTPGAWGEEREGRDEEKE